MSDLKTQGQERSLAAVSKQTRRDFLRVITSARPGALVSVNDYRDLLEQADIPERARGGLWNLAVARGYLQLARHPDGSPRLIPSTGESARRAHVRVYVRTGKEIT